MGNPKFCSEYSCNFKKNYIALFTLGRQLTGWRVYVLWQQPHMILALYYHSFARPKDCCPTKYSLINYDLGLSELK